MSEDVVNEEMVRVEEENNDVENEKDEDNGDDNLEQSQPQLRRSTRPIIKPAYLNDYVHIAEVECERLLMVINDEP